MVQRRAISHIVFRERRPARGYDRSSFRCWRSMWIVRKIVRLRNSVVIYSPYSDTVECHFCVARVLAHASFGGGFGSKELGYVCETNVTRLRLVTSNHMFHDIETDLRFIESGFSERNKLIGCESFVVHSVITPTCNQEINIVFPRIVSN